MLEEYKDIFASIAGLLAMSHMFSGMFICKKIYQAKSSKNIPSHPFVAGLALAILFNQHGRLLQDRAIGMVNFIGIGFNVLYITFYWTWSGPEERRKLGKSLGVAAAAVSVLIGYAQLEDPSVAAVRFGAILITMIMLLISMPLFQIKTIIRTKNTDMIPFPMCLSGFGIGTSWILYGIAAHQPMIVIQNLAVASLTGIQLLLCFIYPGKTVKTE